MLPTVSGHRSEDFKRVAPPLEGELVRLRAIEEADLPRISEMFNDPDVLRYLSAVTFPESLAETRKWWETTRIGLDRQYAFAIETLAAEMAGACSLENLNGRTRSATLGIWIGKPFWNLGYGTDAVRTLSRFGFREMNLQRIELLVHDDNPRGRRAYEKVGFKEEGRLRRAHFVGGRHIDTIVMGLLAEELIEEPVNPTDWPASEAR
jgi:RimJ/RimL family protein N-acetyltransferase